MNKSYEQFKKLYDEIDILISHKVTDSDAEFITWRKRVERFLNSYYNGGTECYDFANTSFSLHILTSGTPNSAWIDACADGLRTTKAVFKVYLEEMQNDMVLDTPISKGKQVKCTNNKVFVVHGHDCELKLAIARILEKQGIEPIILSEKANLGLTIIEKFEKYSDVKAAICLFTDDDLGKAKKDKDPRKRARQNVVFEAGYFIGKLGRNHVVLLANREIEMPSDLSGVVYTDSTMWEMQVLKELKEMGLSVDLNKSI